MKKVISKETQIVEKSVTLCDTCEQEYPWFISWSWSFSCKYDDCYNDYGECHFCSVKCLKAGAAKAMESFSHRDDIAPGRFSIEFDGSHSSREEAKNLMDLLSGRQQNGMV